MSPEPLDRTPGSSREPGAGRAAAAAAEPGGYTLAVLLNVIWRRKWISITLTALGLAAGILYGQIVTPLYLATAQVQPGITAFTESGGPVREWRLKDISYFFRRGLFREAVREHMGWAPGQGRPVIQADFIARGTQNIQGGNVITLHTLSPSPEEAAEVLGAAIGAFQGYAEADTLASGLQLTRRGLQIQIDQVRNELAALATQRARLDLSIKLEQANLKLNDAQKERVGLDLQKILKANEFREKLRQLSDQEAQAARARLQEMDRTLDSLAKSDPGFVAKRDSLLQRLGEEGLRTWMLANVSRNDAEAVSNMIVASLTVRAKINRSQARADSLQHEIQLAGIAAEDLKLKQNVDLDNQRTEIQNRIDDFTLQKEHDLENHRIELEQEILGKQAQLRALNPLEKIGSITTTERPVRPRKLRAAAILGFLGLVGSLVLAFAWEYVSANKDVILAKRAPRA